MSIKDFNHCPDIFNVENIILDDKGKFIGFKIEAIFTHLYTESIKAMKENDLSDDDLEEVVRFSSALDATEECMKTNNVGVIATKFYMLGLAARKLESGYYGKQIGEYNRAMITQIKSDIRTTKLNKYKVIVKKLGVLWARRKWRKDPSIRTGEMADLIWAELHQEFANNTDENSKKYIKEIPGNIDQLKKWFKDIAPQEAKKAGRNRNK